MNALQQLIDLLNAMRQPQQGCAWTRDQTFHSLAPQTLEEVYELVEAIETQQPEQLKQELADLLYHVIFYCQLASEQYGFTLNDVAQQMLDKLQQRMPNAALREQFNATQINDYWQQRKLQQNAGGSLLATISKALPAMLFAQKLQEKAATVGFDWNDIRQVLAKISEEIAELQQEIDIASDQVAAEFGDLLFACINLGRHLGVSAEMALRSTNAKFMQRFAYIEQHAAAAGKVLSDMSLAEMEALWAAAKQRK